MSSRELAPLGSRLSRRPEHSGGMITVLQVLTGIAAVVAAVVGVKHFIFATREAKEEFIDRLRLTCRKLHVIRNPAWDHLRREVLRPWERSAIRSEAQHLVAHAGKKLGREAVGLLRAFVELCEKDLPARVEDRQDYRRAYKKCVEGLEAKIGKFTGKEMEAM